MGGRDLIALVLLVTLAQPPMTPAESFAAGVRARENGREARAHFARAARGFDAMTPSPQVALARARSHALAGNLSQALAAVHDGLALAPYDLELQRDLLALRGTIPYPETADPATRVRPDDPKALRHRVSPWDAFTAAAGFGLLAAIGFVKLLTTRPRSAWAIAGVGLVGTAASGWIAWRIAVDDPRPLLILTTDTQLRRGNGPSYSPRIAEALPRGAEVVELGRRGGWVQVELPGGAAGWLPEANVLQTGVTRSVGGASPS